MAAVGPSWEGVGWSPWVPWPLGATPTPNEDKSPNTELKGPLWRAGLCNPATACDCFLKVSQGDWLRAQKQHNSEPGYQETAGRATEPELFLQQEAPYKKVLGFILCNFFFFLEGKQHELPKAADGSKFWVVKCQADGSEQLGIYGACRRGGENVPI